MKLTTTTFVSVDGVMQGIGAPDEDRSGGFERGGWTTPLFDDETGTYLTEIYQRADAFLFGRRTYEIFAASWGTVGRSEHERARPSRCTRGPSTSHRPPSLKPQWANTTVLSGELAAAVDGLKAEPGGELLVPGSGALIRWLLANDLVDQMDLVIFPVVVGQGTRLFPDSGPDRALELVESRATSRGVTIQVYRPAGRLQFGTSTADLRHWAE